MTEEEKIENYCVYQKNWLSLTYQN
jgi:hypothetical protein